MKCLRCCLVWFFLAEFFGAANRAQASTPAWPTNIARPIQAVAGREPQMRIGLIDGAGSLSIVSLSDARLLLGQDAGDKERAIPAGTSLFVAPNVDFSAHTGSLKVMVGHEGPFYAQGGVRLVPEREDGIAQVSDVAFGQGYAWAGHAHRRYRGGLYIVAAAHGLTLVNLLSVDTLLRGVVPSEMFATAPLAALEAQSIAARNMLLSHRGRRHPNAPYDLCADQHCQVYSGVTQETAATDRAVLNTHGLALMRHDKLVDARYAANCGGYSEDNEVVWPGPKNAALRARLDAPAGEISPYSMGLFEKSFGEFLRHPPHAFCDRAAPGGKNHFRWQRVLDQEALTLALRSVKSRLGTLTAIETGERGRGGRLRDLTLIGTQGKVRLSPEFNIRKFFHNLPSAAFVVHVEHDHAHQVTGVTFSGGGWGHGVGLCQTGAMGRAEAGQTARQILAFYYAGARVARLW